MLVDGLTTASQSRAGAGRGRFWCEFPVSHRHGSALSVWRVWRRWIACAESQKWGSVNCELALAAATCTQQKLRVARRAAGVLRPKRRDSAPFFSAPSPRSAVVLQASAGQRDARRGRTKNTSRTSRRSDARETAPGTLGGQE